MLIPVCASPRVRVRFQRLQPPPPHPTGRVPRTHQGGCDLQTAPLSEGGFGFGLSREWRSGHFPCLVLRCGGVGNVGNVGNAAEAASGRTSYTANAARAV